MSVQAFFLALAMFRKTVGKYHSFAEAPVNSKTVNVERTINEKTVKTAPK